MFDLSLDERGDLAISETGDVFLTESVRQIVLVRLRWILEEWRLGPELGFPYFEEMLVKNPNPDFIGQLIKEEILKVDDVEDAEITNIEFDSQTRKLSVNFDYEVGEEKYKEEVTLYV